MKKSDKKIQAAIAHVKNSQCDAEKCDAGIPFMIIGDIRDLIKILTGVELDNEELELKPAKKKKWYCKPGWHNTKVSCQKNGIPTLYTCTTCGMDSTRYFT